MGLFFFLFAALIVLLKPQTVTILSDTSVSGVSVSQLPALFLIEPSRNIDFSSLLQKKIKINLKSSEGGSKKKKNNNNLRVGPSYCLLVTTHMHVSPSATLLRVTDVIITADDQR